MPRVAARSLRVYCACTSVRSRVSRSRSSPDPQVDHPVEVLLRRAQAVDARDGRTHDHVATGEQAPGRRVPQPLDLLVDRGVLLDVGVGLRDVGLGLVVVVVRHEVLDRVVGEELAKLVGELRRERLVGQHHQGRALDPLDQPGDRGGLAGAGRAEQHDVLLAGPDAALEVVDRGRLVAGRHVVGHDLERCHGALEVVNGSHASRLRRASDSQRHAFGAGPGPRAAGLGASGSRRSARQVGARRHPRPVPWTARHPGRHDVLDAVAVRPLGLEQLGELAVRRTARRTARSPSGGDVVVAEAHGVSVAMGALPDLGRGPDARYPGASAAAGRPRPSQVDRALQRRRRRARPARWCPSERCRLSTAATPTRGPGRVARRRAGTASRAAAPGPGAGVPKRRSSSRHPRQASCPVTFCSMAARRRAPPRPGRSRLIRQCGLRCQAARTRRSVGDGSRRRRRSPQQVRARLERPVGAGPPRLELDLAEPRAGADRMRRRPVCAWYWRARSCRRRPAGTTGRPPPVVRR